MHMLVLAQGPFEALGSNRKILLLTERPFQEGFFRKRKCQLFLSLSIDLDDIASYPEHSEDSTCGGKGIGLDVSSLIEKNKFWKNSFLTLN